FRPYPVRYDYPKIQILTIEELLPGKTIDMRAWKANELFSKYVIRLMGRMFARSNGHGFEFAYGRATRPCTNGDNNRRLLLFIARHTPPIWVDAAHPYKASAGRGGNPC